MKIKVIRCDLKKSGVSEKTGKPWKIYEIGFTDDKGVMEKASSFEPLDPTLTYEATLEESEYQGKDGKPHTALKIKKAVAIKDTPVTTSTPSPEVKASTAPVKIKPDLKTEFLAHKVELAKAVNELTWFINFLSRVE